MFRKHFRIRRLVLGLAFAAFAAPAAQASTGYLVDGGPVPVSHVTVAAPTRSFDAYGARSQAMANRAVEARQGARITPLEADGLRWQAKADAYARQQSTRGSVSIAKPQPISASSGFDWTDAGIGASSALGVALLLLVAVAVGRRNQHSGLTSA